MTLLLGDLTTLAAAQAYVEPRPSDVLLSGLITRVSMMVRSFTNRSFFLPRSYVRQFSGTATGQLMLPDYPVLGAALTSLVVDGTVVSIAPQPDDNGIGSPGFGYRFQPWDGFPPGMPAAIDLVGSSFWSGQQNIVASYRAGYQVTDEAQTVPGTPYTVTPLGPNGGWATDEGVTFAATGVALTPISSGTPTTGQYLPPTPDATTSRAYYTFAAADAAKGVLLSYGFVPADLEQVVLELIAERASYRRRTSVRSQTLASQESIVYMDGSMNGWACAALQPYVSVLPPPIGASV